MSRIAASWRDFVKCVMFINLDSRTDRRAEIERVLRHDMKIPDEQVIRIPGVKADPGSKGCTLSHIEALTRAQGVASDYICILEDDFMLAASMSQFDQRLQQAWESIESFDMLLLAMTPIRLERKPELPESCYAVKSALASPGYIVPKRYVPEMLALMKRALHTNTPHDLLMQQKQGDRGSQWFGFYPPIAHQRPSFSDVENRPTDYRYLEIDGHMLTDIHAVEPAVKKWSASRWRRICE